MKVVTSDDVSEAIEKIRELLVQRVRAEQLVDQLTRLPNLAALQEQLRSKIVNEPDFWIAFVEVDRFKSINDQYGYEHADALLQKIADQLTSALSWFSHARAFRAHGDEFYLLGTAADGERGGEQAGAADDDEVRAALDHVCASIAMLRVPVGAEESMRCTVSVGWLRARDLSAMPDFVTTSRSVLVCLEIAVAEAKRTRGCVVQYHPEMTQQKIITLRADCRECRAKFSVDLSVETNRASADLTCPNCAAAVTRPAPPRLSILPLPIETL